MAGELFDNQGRGEVVRSWPTVHPDGRRFGLAVGAAALFALVILDWELLGWPLLFLSIAVFAFFRDPERVVPQANDVILSPADGVVEAIREIAPPTEFSVEDGMSLRALPVERVVCVSIALSLFDVHVNRAPIAGVIQRIVYMPGSIFNPGLDKASADNERQHILIERGDGTLIGMTQIAGWVARRIVPFVKRGDTIAAGQRIGLIRFGSRVDVYLPAGSAAAIILGQRVVAGETAIGRLGRVKVIEGVAL